MKIILNPKVSELVNSEVLRCNERRRTKLEINQQSKPTTADELVNELLWIALRSGDITEKG